MLRADKMKNNKRIELLGELETLIQPLSVDDDLSDEVIFRCYDIITELIKIIKEDKRDLQKEFDNLVDNIFDTFNNIDTSLYTDDAYYDGDFYFEDLHNGLIEGLFCEIDKKIYNFYNQNNLFEVMFVLLVTYYAIQKEPEVIDEYDVFMDYNEALYDYWQDLFIKFIEVLKNSTLNQGEKEKFDNFLKSFDRTNIIDDIYEALDKSDG